MGGLQGFWEHIDKQLEDLKSATSAEDVFRICPTTPGLSADAARGFFAGGGGDGEVSVSLEEAGWTMVSYRARYYWVMRAPNGDKITYVEGDLYSGNQMLPAGG